MGSTSSTPKSQINYDSRSLRRELNDTDLERFNLSVRPVDEDFASRDRSYLEAEVRRLRAELNQKDLIQLQALLEYRNLLTSQAGGKDESDSLNIHATPEPVEEFRETLRKAGRRALGGGVAGALSMVTSVCSLMWIRTIINTQYRDGGTMMGTMRKLLAEGGVVRLYRGLAPALVMAPLSRFGDTAANSGMLTLLDNRPKTKDLPIPVKTAAAAGAAALWRMTIMPIDTLKTSLQVEGRNAFPMLRNKVKTRGIGVMWHGAFGASASSLAGFAPWFTTYNTLNKYLPRPTEGSENVVLGKKLARNAAMGFCSSAVSDTLSNSIRVVKVIKQTSPESITYRQAMDGVIAKDGVRGLLGRGLSTKILGNGIQSALFLVVWKYAEDYIARREAGFSKRNEEK